MNIQIKAGKQHFPVVLPTMTKWFQLLSLTFGSVIEILKCDHSNESYWAVLSCCVVYCTLQGGSSF